MAENRQFQKCEICYIIDSESLSLPLLWGNMVRKPQIGFYSNGVGNSNFRPFAALGGIFGFGLKRNVLSLYRFLCRNYKPGDEIFAFGFSRGAFTIRLLVHLVASQGVIRYEDSVGGRMAEAELKRQSRDGFRRMHADWRLNTPLANVVLRGLRWGASQVRSVALQLRSVPKQPEVWSEEPKIVFVGLWDTVAAYGGPIVELTRAFDDWIWPLTMPDYRLSAKVGRARHALALDDERDSFQPLLWDETVEQPATPGQPPRLKQVWFTGMHSDVGGGYPDDSLSYVSLTWMIEELGDLVRLHPIARQWTYDLANDFGPLHDSRQGIGAYYRYQPRRIASFLDPPTTSTLGLRDPNVRRIDPRTQKSTLQGLIAKPLIHESVLRRIIDGTDGYAPISLPRRIAVDRRVAKTPHADRLPRLPETLQDDLDRLADAAERLGGGERDHLDLVWDLVWQRRATYFVTVLLTLGLLALPLVSEGACTELGCTDDRWEISSLAGAVKGALPGFVHFWIDGWAAHPLRFLALLAAVLASMAVGKRIEGRLRDRLRSIWAAATQRIARATEEGQREASPQQIAEFAPPELPTGSSGFWSRLRDSRAYQRTIQLLKWRWTPKVLGPLLIVLAALCAASVVAQLRVFWSEETNRFCSNAPINEPDFYRIDRPCNRTQRNVEALHTYEIRFTPTGGHDADWRDRGPFGDSVKASLAGVDEADETWAMKLAMPLKRVIGARYLQPIAVLRQHHGTHRPFVSILDPVHQPDGTYLAKFRAPVSGKLMLYANDAIPPFLRAELFYENNRGEARISICDTAKDCAQQVLPSAEAEQAGGG